MSKQNKLRHVKSKKNLRMEPELQRPKRGYREKRNERPLATTISRKPTIWYSKQLRAKSRHKAHLSGGLS